jgi:hypothetical protein
MTAPSNGNYLTRLSILPNSVNWKGEWIIGEQYYQNDVTLDPSGGSFILLETASLSGIDPAFNPAWTEVSGVATGVRTIRTGNGIELTGDLMTPTISNTGVLEVIDGEAITINLSNPSEPQINTTAVAGVFAGDGIAVTGQTPRITNTGVITLRAGAGIQSTSIFGNQYPELTNTGVHSLILSGLNTTGGQKPVLSNPGVLSVAVVKNLELTGDPKAPTINFLGSPPQLSRVFDVTVNPIETDPLIIPPVGDATFIITLEDGLFKNLLANGAPPSNTGTFMLDFSSFVLDWQVVGPFTIPGTDAYFVISFIDDTTPGSVPYNLQYGMVGNILAPYEGPGTTNPGLVKFNINDARNRCGLRTVDYISFFNPLLSDMVLYSASGVWGTYYPNGIQ